MGQTIGVPKEVHPGERRVALTPDTAARLEKLGYRVAMEADAGAAAKFSDVAYKAVGVDIVDDAKSLWARSDIVIKVRPPEQHPDLGVHETQLLQEGATLIAFLWPAQNEGLLKRTPFTKKLGLGIIDARNSTLEPTTAIAERIKVLGDGIDPDHIHVSPSAGLEFLPREVAQEKLRLLAEGVRQAEGVPA